MSSTYTTATTSEASSTEKTTHNDETDATSADWTTPQTITTKALLSTERAATFHPYSTTQKYDNTTDGHCQCTCSPQLNLDDPDELEKLKPKLDAMKKELLVEKTSLSNTKRRFLSAPDDRPSSKYIGTIGIAVLVIVGLALVSPDLVQLCRWFLHKFKN